MNETRREEMEARHKRELKALDSILFSETGMKWMSRESHPAIRGYVANAHAMEIARQIQCEAAEG